MAESSRCSTNQFSTQPAMMLLANSNTPVNAANSRQGPSSVSGPDTPCGASQMLSTTGTLPVQCIWTFSPENCGASICPARSQ